jgi:arsenate reductase (glutaredoxin)
MKEIARNKHQITAYYNPDSSVAKKTLAYLQESKIPVLTIDILKNPPTGSQWMEIANDLGVPVSDLILKDHPVYQKQYAQSELSDHDWLKIMQFHPEVIDQPIVIRGERVLLVKTPTDVLQLIHN